MQQAPQMARPDRTLNVGDSCTHNNNTKRRPSSPSLPRLNEMMRDKLQRRIPEWFGLTSNIFDRMCCCSYAGAQGEVPEMAYSFDLGEENSLLATSTGPADDLEKVPREVTTVCSEETAATEQTICDSSIFRGWSEDEGARMEDCETVHLDGSRGVIRKSIAAKSSASSSSSHSSHRYSPTLDWEAQQKVTRRDNSTHNQSHGSSRTVTPREIALPTANTKTFVPRQHSSQDHGLSTSRTQQPSKQQQQQHHDKQKYLYGASKSRHSLSEHAYRDSRRIRKVQSESLAELPYLSVTEGYEC